MITSISDIEAIIEKYGDPEDHDKIPPSSIHGIAVELAQKMINNKNENPYILHGEELERTTKARQ